PASWAGLLARPVAMLCRALDYGPEAPAGRRPQQERGDSVDDFWWAMLITMLYIPFLFLWGFTLFDMAFRKDLHAWSKLLWALFILFIPLIGVLVYFITRPKDYDAWAPTPAMYGSSGGYYAPPAAAQTAQMM